MKHLFKVAMLLILPLLAFGQETDYQMFENFYFTAKSGHGDELKAALASHNKRFHGVGNYRAQVYTVINGPNAGKYVWSMGPTTWTKIENRPKDEAHDGDWDKNIGIHIESYDATNYFKLDPKRSSFKAPFDLNLLQLWMIDVADGEDYRFNAVMDKVVAVYADSDLDTPMGLYDRQLSGTHGIDVAIVWFANSLEWMDEDSDFKGKYETKYGEGSFQPFLDEWYAVTDRIDVELWRFIPELSGHDGKAETRDSE